MTLPQDPNWHWDGTAWLWWNGSQWQRVEGPSPELTYPEPEPVAVATASAIPDRRGSGIRVPGSLLIAILSVFALLFVLVGGGVVYLISRDSGVQAGQSVSVTTEPISTSIDPFTPSSTTGTDVAITPVEPATSVRVPGGKAGLYGGTLQRSQCDRPKLVSFLAENPDKATAWAQVHGIGTDGIAPFIDRLTSVVLRSDTLVTNHGFASGKATTFTSVLQAGTAVLVNDQGVPVVKCYCGNPLTVAPVDRGEFTYKGATWPAWNPQRITLVEANPTTITNIILINVTTSEPFSRPVGTDGISDVPTTLPPTGDSTPTTPPAPPTPTYTGDDAYAIFMAAVDTCVTRMGDGSFNGLRTNAESYRITKTLGKVNGVFVITIESKSGDEGTYKFVVNVPARTIVPGNEAGAGAAETCRELDTG